MKKTVVINFHKDVYEMDRIDYTLSVGELIDILSQYDEDSPVIIGNDPTGLPEEYGWYTYGAVYAEDIYDEHRFRQDFKRAKDIRWK